MGYYGLWWFIMVYDGLWWVYDGLLWCMMVYYGLWWFIMVYGGLLWFMMVYYGLWWFIMVYDGLLWFMMVYWDILGYGSLVISHDLLQDTSWNSWNQQWNMATVHGYASSLEGKWKYIYMWYIYDIYTSVYMMGIYNIGWVFQCIYIYTTSIYSSKPIHASPGLQSFRGWSFWWNLIAYGEIHWSDLVR
jgi:hypothetical protein